MKVKRLKMTSFRGISDLTLEFHETEPTVFIGINGVGKSSILDCLAILLSWLLARIQFAPEVKDSFRVRQVQPVVMRQGQLIQEPQEVKDGRYLNKPTRY